MNASDVRSWQLLPFSAEDDTKLDAVTARLGRYLAQRPNADLADVAYTLQTGRHATGGRRRFVVAGSTADAAAVLTGGVRDRIVTGAAPRDVGPVVFTFAGQGGQHVGMTRDLYATDPGFRADVDECCELSAPALGLDLRSVLYPDGEDAVRAADRALATIEVGQPAVFVTQYALARLWARWGARPTAVAGHSLGAYAAACVAGVFSAKDAVTVVVRRGQLLRGLPSGAMAAVRLTESRTARLLPEGLTIAAVNGPDQIAVSGPTEQVERFVREFPEPGVDVRLLKIATAGHSALVEPILDEFERFVSGVDLQEPTIPVVSDTTGRWADPAEIATPAYWRLHMRRMVRFAEVMDTLATLPNGALLEVGPGMALTALARQHPTLGEHHRIVQSLPHPADPQPEPSVLLTAAGQLWLTGIDLNWRSLHPPRPRGVMT
jgi:phthiocerol/phenolphthiocerol synthesis type-I polyketide synthase E